MKIKEEKTISKETEKNEGTPTPTPTGGTPKPKPKADTPIEIIRPGGDDPKGINNNKSFNSK